MDRDIVIHVSQSHRIKIPIFNFINVGFVGQLYAQIQLSNMWMFSYFPFSIDSFEYSLKTFVWMLLQMGGIGFQSFQCAIALFLKPNT